MQTYIGYLLYRNGRVIAWFHTLEYVYAYVNMRVECVPYSWETISVSPYRQQTRGTTDTYVLEEKSLEA